MTEDLADFTILGFPLQVWRRSAAHMEAVQREFEIIRAGEREDSIPNRLKILREELTASFGVFADPTWAVIQDAADRGEESIDVTFRLPPAAGEAARRLAGMLDEVDEYCREGEHLLSLATPPDLVAFRRWFLAEFERQAAGEAPTPWRPPPDPDEGGQPSGREAGSLPALLEGWGLRSEGDEATVSVTGDLDISTAGHLRDVIQSLRNDGVRRLHLDLRSVGFTDSVGIGLLVATHSRMEEEGGGLQLTVSPGLLKLLDLSGLSRVLRTQVAEAGDEEGS